MMEHPRIVLARYEVEMAGYLLDLTRRRIAALSVAQRTDVETYWQQFGELDEATTALKCFPPSVAYLRPGSP